MVDPPGVFVKKRKVLRNPREMVGGEDKSVIDDTNKHEADTVHDLISEITKTLSSEETWSETLHGGSYPCHFCDKTYEKAQQLAKHKMLSDLRHNACKGS